MNNTNATVVPLREDSTGDDGAAAGWREEQTRIVREATRASEAERRTFGFALQHTIAVAAFALAPAIPGARALFGALTVPQAFLIVGPALVAIWASVYSHARGGFESASYHAIDALETFLQYGLILGIIYASRVTCSTFWGLVPACAVFFGSTRPFRVRLYATVIACGHLTLIAAQLARGDRAAAGVAVAFGLASLVTFGVTARKNRCIFALEAKRNILRARLNDAVQERERAEIARSLRDGVGREIEALARELDGEGAAHARSALGELGTIARRAPSRGEPRELAEVARKIDEKCRPLCANLDYALSVAGERAEVDDGAALALLRVAQELVRNAITHGKAAVIRVALASDGGTVTLLVRDDGGRLSPAAFARGTGGLTNARRWLGERGGSLELLPAAHGAAATELRAVLPIPPPSSHSPAASLASPPSSPASSPPSPASVPASGAAGKPASMFP